MHPLDPDLGIAWPDDVPVILSDKDAAAPSLEEARPRWAAAPVPRLPCPRAKPAQELKSRLRS